MDYASILFGIIGGLKNRELCWNMASLACQLSFFFFFLIQRSRVRNAPKLVGWVGGGWAGNSASGSLALHVFQPNAAFDS